ncbi:hypothetical protein O988_06771 [Pseudogymnoascus sp. VKM F-3808]|nr:hypothetical protein O988_06771 [Pseudogymnoascus sp. VKM F-3808]
MLIAGMRVRTRRNVPFSSKPRRNGSEEASSTRCSIRAQQSAECHSRHVTAPRLRDERDAARRRPPRPLYREQTDLSLRNPDSASDRRGKNGTRQPADRRPQGRERSTVQFQGEAPRLPTIRATAIFREPQNPDPETLRHYLGTSGVPFEDPEITASERPESRDHRSGGRSSRRQRQPSTPHPHDNGSSQYMDRPLPPTPLRPNRPSSTPRPPPVPPRSSQRLSSSQRSSQPFNDQQLVLRSSSQNPSRPSSDQQMVLRRSSSQRPPDSPSYHRGRPTDRELNRISREIDTAESAWVNAGGPSSSQRPVIRDSTGSLTAPRRHRSQRDGDSLAAVSAGRLAVDSNQAIIHKL